MPKRDIELMDESGSVPFTVWYDVATKWEVAENSVISVTRALVCNFKGK